MIFNTSPTDIIKVRRSVRTYTKKAVEQEKKGIMREVLDNLRGQYFRFDLIDFQLEEGMKLGTYGMIKGASTFIIGILNKELMDDYNVAVEFGYAFEGIILKVTELGLGTCWLGGTFNSKDAMKMIALKDNEQVVMVSPIGYGGNMRGFEKLTRKLSKADQRKPWKELFFHKDFNTPLTIEEAGPYAHVLHMVRLAPSASNKQPWRILKSHKTYDFYNVNAPTSSNKKQKFMMSFNDMGIAKAHFDYVANEKGLKGQWLKKDDIKDEPFTYVCSWEWHNEVEDTH